MLTHNWKKFIQDALESITKIQDNTKGLTLEQFEDNSLLSDAILYRFIVIAGALNHLLRAKEQLKTKHADIPWDEYRA